MMKVRCKKNTSAEFDLEEVTMAYSHTIDYGLKVGNEYLVTGMAIFKRSNCIYYLIDTKVGPFFYPYLLFDITYNSLPKNWYMRVIGRSESTCVHTLCGFYELCNVENFYEKLVERDSEAWDIYDKRKAELENKLE